MKPIFLIFVCSVYLIKCQLFETLNQSPPPFLPPQQISRELPLQPTVFQTVPALNSTVNFNTPQAFAPGLPKFIETNTNINNAFDQSVLNPINFNGGNALGVNIINKPFSQKAPNNANNQYPMNMFNTNPNSFNLNNNGNANLKSPSISALNNNPLLDINFNSNNNPGLYTEFLNENHGGAPLPDFIREDIQPKIFREPLSQPTEGLEDQILGVLSRFGISFENKTLILQPDVKLKVRNSTLSIKDIDNLMNFNARLMKKCGENLEFCMIKDNVLDEEIASEIGESEVKNGKGMNFLEVEVGNNEIQDILSGDLEDSDPISTNDNLEDFDFESLS